MAVLMSLQEEYFDLFLDDRMTKISKMKTFVQPQLLKKKYKFKKGLYINHELRGTFQILFRGKLNTGEPSADMYK